MTRYVAKINNPEFIQRFWSQVDKTPGHGPHGDCWIWTGPLQKGRRGGYGSLRCDGSTKKTHRISWHLANGPIPNDLQVLHKCDVRKCVNPIHLFLGTNKDNVDDKVKKGRHPRGAWAASYSNPARGEDAGQSIFSNDNVLEMRRLYSEGVKIPAIAVQFDSAPHVINQIVHGVRWSHLPGALPPHKAYLYRDRVLAMRAEGISQTQIGKILGFSDAAISRLINNKIAGIISKPWRTGITPAS